MKSVSKKTIVLFACFFVALFLTVSPVMAQNRYQAPESFADLAENLLPTVVNISTTQLVVEQPRRRRNPFEGFPQGNPFPPGSPFDKFFEDFFGGQSPFGQPFLEDQNGQEEDQAPPREYRRPNALGSGFVIDAEKGYIVTNNHVIADADEIKVILHDDTTLDAKIIGRDEKTDLAVLQVETDVKLVATKWGDSDIMRVGDWVLAIGNPFGLGGTVTKGIISARQRNINAGPYDDFIQTDASINRGNSGGPMFNLKGEVIGINTAIFSPSGGSVGIGFAIPSTMAQSVIRQLISYGQTRRGWLGVQIQTVTDEIAESLGLSKARGALVSNVTKDSPAEKAGIKAGDIILSFDGQPIDEMRRLPRVVAETDIGKKSAVEIWRDGKSMTLRAEVGELEKAEEEQKKNGETPKEDKVKTKDTEIKDIGLSVAVLNQELRDRYRIPSTVSGLVVTKVDASSMAAEKRVMAGDVIVEFNQKEVKTTDELQKLIREAKSSKRNSVLLLLNRGGNLRFVALRMN